MTSVTTVRHGRCDRAPGPQPAARSGADESRGPGPRTGVGPARLGQARQPCLSSRIAYGVEVTPERVARVDAAEVWLREKLGIRELRVRLEASDLARIELPLADFQRLAAPELRDVASAT